MPRQNVLHTSWTKGEISPLSRGRADVNLYSTGADTIENFVIRPQGPLFRRSGTKFIIEARDSSTQSRLIPFELSDVAGYELLFGEQYIWVFKNRAPLIDQSTDYDTPITAIGNSSGNFLLTVAPLSRSISSITDEGSTALVVTGTAHGYRTGSKVRVSGSSIAGFNGNTYSVTYVSPTSFRISSDPAATVGAGGIVESALVRPGDPIVISGSTTSTAINGTWIVKSVPAYDQIVLAHSTYAAPGAGDNGSAFPWIAEISSSFTDDELAAISFTQSADVMYLAHGDHAPSKIQRQDDYTWTLTDVVFNDGPYLPVQTTSFVDPANPQNGTRFDDVLVYVESYAHTATIKVDVAWGVADTSKYIEYRDGDQWRLGFVTAATNGEFTGTINVIENVMLYIDETTRLKFGKERMVPASIGNSAATPSGEIKGGASGNSRPSTTVPSQQRIDPRDEIQLNGGSSPIKSQYSNTFSVQDVGKYIRVHTNGTTGDSEWRLITGLDRGQTGQIANVAAAITMVSNPSTRNAVVSNHARTSTLRAFRGSIDTANQTGLATIFSSADIGRMIRVGFGGRWTWGRITALSPSGNFSNSVTVRWETDFPRDVHNATYLAGNGDSSATTSGWTYDWRLGAWGDPGVVETSTPYAHWDMNGIVGVGAEDVVGSIDLPLFNTSADAVTSTDGILGRAFRFNIAADDYLASTDANLKTGDILFGFTGWINPISLPAATQHVLGRWSTAGNRQYRLIITAAGVLQFEASGNGTASTTVAHTAALTVGTWAFFGCWHDPVANTISIRVDDNAAVSAAHTTGVFTGGTATYFSVGYDEATATSNLDAIIDDLKFWKGSFPTAELPLIYNQGTGAPYSITGPGYPRTVCFHEQRLAWGGAKWTPETFWMSVSGDFENMLPSELDSTVLDDSAITYTLASNKANPIKWMISGPSLTIGTSGGEWQVRASSSINEAITPSNIKAIDYTSHGVIGTCLPSRIGPVILFVDRSGEHVRELAYSAVEERYDSDDISVISEHILRNHGGGVQACYQQNPHSIFWVLCDDGTLSAVTRNVKQEVIAWHHHTVTSGTIESISVIPSEGGEVDELWMLVARTISGSTKRTVELLEDDYYPTSSSSRIGGRFVDGHLLVEGWTGTGIAGLNHLEGLSVVPVVDGVAQAARTVSSGAITLDSGATTEVVIGLAYNSDLVSLPPEGGSQFGTSQGQVKRVVDLDCRFLSSANLKHGPSVALLTAKALPVTSPAVWFTGTERLVPRHGYDRESVWMIRQDRPEPLNLLFVVTKVETNE